MAFAFAAALPHLGDLAAYSLSQGDHAPGRRSDPGQMASMMDLRKKNLLLALLIGAFAIALYFFAIYHVMSGTRPL